jgi:hypothetical protein
MFGRKSVLPLPLGMGLKIKLLNGLSTGFRGVSNERGKRQHSIAVLGLPEAVGMSFLAVLLSIPNLHKRSPHPPK